MGRRTLHSLYLLVLGWVDEDISRVTCAAALQPLETLLSKVCISHQRRIQACRISSYLPEEHEFQVHHEDSYWSIIFIAPSLPFQGDKQLMPTPRGRRPPCLIEADDDNAINLVLMTP